MYRDIRSNKRAYAEYTNAKVRGDNVKYIPYTSTVKSQLKSANKQKKKEDTNDTRKKELQKNRALSL